MWSVPPLLYPLPLWHDGYVPSLGQTLRATAATIIPYPICPSRYCMDRGKVPVVRRLASGYAEASGDASLSEWAATHRHRAS